MQLKPRTGAPRQMCVCGESQADSAALFVPGPAHLFTCAHLFMHALVDAVHGAAWLCNSPVKHRKHRVTGLPSVQHKACVPSAIFCKLHWPDVMC